MHINKLVFVKKNFNRKTRIKERTRPTIIYSTFLPLDGSFVEKMFENFFTWLAYCVVAPAFLKNVLKNSEAIKIIFRDNSYRLVSREISLKRI
jgi:hypothetical protein